MKKLTAILFVCFALVPFVARGADSYEECERSIFREVAFNNPPSEYTAILNNLVKEAKDKAANWAKTTRLNSKRLSCELGGVMVYNAPCENKTPAECGVPEDCWCMLAQVSCDELLLKESAQEKYKQQKCGNLPKQEKPAKTNNVNENNTTDANNTQSKQDKKAQKAAAKEAECKSKGKVAKQDKLGIWSCVDSDEAKTTKAQESAKTQAQKEYDADISKIVAAYQKKYQQLSKKSK